jgi:hypothetical protein
MLKLSLRVNIRVNIFIILTHNKPYRKSLVKKSGAELNYENYLMGIQ